MQTIATITMPQEYRNQSWFVMLDDAVCGGITLAEFVSYEGGLRYPWLYKTEAEAQAEIDEFHHLRQEEADAGERDEDHVETTLWFEPCTVDSNGFIFLATGRVWDGNEFGTFVFGSTP